MIIILFVVIAVGLLLYVLNTEKLLGLNFWEVYQNLANPSVRIVKITPGMRKEEVADRFGDTLGWDEKQKESAH